MDDISRKLEFNNPIIKLQAINKLVTLIEKNKTNGEPITKTTPKIPELEYLWTLTDDECSITRNAACRALVSLSVRGHAETTFILEGIFNHLPSTKCLNGFILAIRNLLIVQRDFHSTAQTSYQQRINQHLFVMILKNNPQSWPYLLEQVKYILYSEKERQQMLDAMMPFLEYILWDPNRPPELAYLRQSIIKCIGTLTLRSRDTILHKLLMESYNWMKLDTTADLQESLELLQILSEVIPQTAPQLDFLLVMLATVCLEMMHHDLDPCNGLQTLLKLFRQHLKDDWNVFIDAAALLLSSMMELTCATNETLLLEIIEVVIHLKCISKLIRASFVLPLLQVMAMPVNFMPFAEHRPSCQQKSAALLREVENACISMTQQTDIRADDLPENVSVMSESIHPNLSCALQYVKLARSMEIIPYAAYEWLEHIQTKPHSLCNEMKFASQLTVGILIHGLQHKELVKKAVSAVIAIAHVDSSQAPSLFPVLLHKLGLETDIDLRLHILHSLPDIATHKVAIGPVLQTLLMLSSTPSLQALSIRLTAKLWHHQDRIFPFLNQLLIEPEEKVMEATEYDVLVAKAASIKEVCMERPEQFGCNLLPSLSSILAKNLKDSGGVPSVLAIEGIKSLCQAEVIDLPSTWKVLSKKLSSDTRPQVVKALCELLSIAPDLEVNNLEYENFRSEIIYYLWKQINANKTTTAVGSAYRALAKFPVEFYKLKHFPDAAKKDLKLPANLASTPFEKAKKPEDVLTYIPGSCFMSLLQSMDNQVLPDYGYFLSQQIIEEVKGLPRGVYHSSLRLSKLIQHNKVLAAIPSLLATKQEYNKVPGLQGSLSAGVLLSYEPSVEYGKDGEPLPRSFAKQAIDYQKRLEILLSEVPIEAAEWQRSLALLQAWSAFVERLFFVSVEGRKAELEMQKTHGTLSGGDKEFEKLTANAWLFVRDRISDCLKSAARGKPASQGNAALALGALAAAVSKFTTMMDEETSSQFASDHMDHDAWMTLVYNTVTSIIDPALVQANKGRIFNWFQGSEKSSSLSMLVRACAAISLAYFAPCLTLNSCDKASQVIDKLMMILRKSDSPAIQLYAGLGLGIYITHLYQKHFVETGGTEARNLLNAAMKNLMQYSVSDDIDSKVGSVLGLTIATSAMCLDPDSDTRLNACDVQSVIREKIESESPMSVIHEVLCMSWVCVTVAACTTSILSIEAAEIVLRKLEHMLTKNPNNCGVAASLGLMIHWLQRINFPNAPEMKDHLLKVWLPTLASESASTLSRLSALNGLCSLFGLQNFLLQIPDELLEMDSEVGLNELLHLLSEIVSVSKDIGMQNCCAWMLGQLYSVTSKKGHSQNSLPLNYSYLKESSLLRATVDYVIEFLKKGETEDLVQPEPVEVCLRALAQPFPRALPPLNWASLLSPFIRSFANDNLKNSSILISLNQTNSSVAAASLMSTCISNTFFNTLPTETQCAILEGLPQLLKGIPVAKIHAFLDVELTTYFQSTVEKSGQLILSALRGITKCLQSSSLSSAVSHMLIQVTENIYNILKPSDKEILKEYCKCLQAVKQNIVDEMTTVINVVSIEIEKALCVRCQLVTQKCFPLSWLNSLIDTIVVSECSVSLDCLYECLQQSNDQLDICLEWLMSIVGRTKLVVEWKSNLQIRDVEHMCQVVNSFVDVFALAVLALSTRFLCYSPSFHQSKLGNLELLPLAMQVLLAQPPYNTVTTKIIDWLIGLCENDILTRTKTKIFQASLLGLRHRDEFKKTSTWTNVLSLTRSNL